MRSANKYFLQEAAQWTLVGVTLLACVCFFQDINNLIVPADDEAPLVFATQTKSQANAKPAFSGEVRLNAERRGHFVFTGDVDGRPVTFMADTGASIIALTYEDARRAGLSPASLDFSASVSAPSRCETSAPRSPKRARSTSISLA